MFFVLHRRKGIRTLIRRFWKSPFYHWNYSPIGLLIIGLEPIPWKEQILNLSCLPFPPNEHCFLGISETKRYVFYLKVKESNIDPECIYNGKTRRTTAQPPFAFDSYFKEAF